MKSKRNLIAIISLITLGGLVGCSRNAYAKPDSSTTKLDHSVNTAVSDNEEDSTSFSSSEKDSTYSSEKDSTSTSDSSSSTSVPEKAVCPVYQGMVVLNALTGASSANALGHDISDYVSQFPDITDENPVDYCVAVNQKVKLLVKFHNLDKAKVDALAINGKKYDVDASMTTLEGVTVEVDAYTKSGYDTLTLTDIAFTDSLNVVGNYSEEHKLTLGVSYENMITAKISSSVIMEDKATFGLSFANIESTLSKGQVIAYLSDGKDYSENKVLTIDADKNATVSFGNLETGKEYYFGIAASYDLFDGKGLHYSWILKHNFTSEMSYFLDSFTVTQTSIDCKVKSNVSDSSSANITSIALMDGNTEVKKLTTIGESVTFTDLLSNHDYDIVLSYTYSGKAYTQKYSKKTIAKVAPTVLVKYSNVTQSSFKYELAITDVDSVCVIDSLKLVNGTSETELNEQSGEQTSLLRNATYEIKVEYHYDLNDGKGDQAFTITQPIILKETLEPTVSFAKAEGNEMNIAFQYEVSAEEGIDVTVDRVSLYDGTEEKDYLLGEEIVNKEGDFAGLYSDQEYILSLTYRYDLNDGNGEQTKTITKTVKTSAIRVPGVTIKANKYGKDFISGTVEIDQDYDITKDIKVEIYEDQIDADGNSTGYTLKEESSGTSFNFQGLKSNNSYKLKCSYVYSLNTKNETGLISGSAKDVIRNTTFDYTLSDLQLDNTNPIEAGQNVYMSMKLHVSNKESLQLSSIVVNGTTLSPENNSYLVTGDEDGEVRFKVKTSADDLESYEKYTSSEDGMTSFTVEKVTVYNTAENKTYDFYVGGNYSVKTKIYGRVKTEKAYFVNSENEKIDYYEPGDNVGVVVEFNNPYKYDIKTINGRSDITKIDDSKYRFSIDTSSEAVGFKALQMASFTYNLGDTTKTMSMDNVYAKAFVVNDKTEKSVSTWNAFYNMQDNYVYKLENDLDFKDVPAQYKNLTETGKTFDGVFEGAGYSIKNLKFASTIENQDVDLGLFKSGSMIIDSLKLENVYFALDLENYGTTSRRIGHVGGFIATSDNAILNNCAVDNRSSIDFENGTESSSLYYDSSYVGGFVGKLGTFGEINNCVNECVVASENGYAGGFVGEMSGSMNYCYNLGSVQLSSSSTYGYVGAFVGSFNRDSATSKISNSVNLGPDRFYSSKIAMIGSCTNSFDNAKKGQTENTYNLFKLYDDTSDKRNNIQKLKRADIDSAFFTDTLHFDTDIWDVSKVNSNSKIYPTLKVFEK